MSPSLVYMSPGIEDINPSFKDNSPNALASFAAPL